jgi:hypothetical protein
MLEKIALLIVLLLFPAGVGAQVQKPLVLPAGQTYFLVGRAAADLQNRQANIQIQLSLVCDIGANFAWVSLDTDGLLIYTGSIKVFSETLRVFSTVTTTRDTTCGLTGFAVWENSTGAVLDPRGTLTASDLLAIPVSGVLEAP